MISEADTNINNVEKPLNIFCDNAQASKTKNTVSSFNLCETNQSRRSNI